MAKWTLTSLPFLGLGGGQQSLRLMSVYTFVLVSQISSLGSVSRRLFMRVSTVLSYNKLTFLLCELLHHVLTIEAYLVD